MRSAVGRRGLDVSVASAAIAAAPFIWRSVTMRRNLLYAVILVGLDLYHESKGRESDE